MLISQYGLLFPKHGTSSETPLRRPNLPPRLGVARTHTDAAVQKTWVRQAPYPGAGQSWLFARSAETKQWPIRSAAGAESARFRKSPNSSQQAFPNVAGIKAIRHDFLHLPLGLQAFSSVASITCTIKRPIPEVFCERAGDKQVTNREIGRNHQNWQQTRRGGSHTDMEASSGKGPAHVSRWMRGKESSARTLISLFTFLLLGFDVLL